MTDPFTRLDPATYARPPRMTTANAIALVRSILVALPKDAPANILHHARAMRTDAAALQGARKAERLARQAEAEAAERTPREVDNEADGLHATSLRRIEDHERLAGHDDAVAAEAATLKAALYPRGIDFTRGDMLSQWNATEEWFETLAEGRHEKSFRALVGGGFLDALRTVHAEYGRVLGITQKAAQTPPKVDLTAALAALSASMQDLVLQLVALANDKSAAAELRAAARLALQPIDRHRDGNARRTARRAAPEAPAASANASTTPAAPTPAAPAAPPDPTTGDDPNETDLPVV